MFAASLRARLLSGAHGAGSPVAEPSVSGVLFIDYTAPAAEAEAGAARPPPLRYSVDKRHTSLFQSCRPAAGRAPAAGRCGAATTPSLKMQETLLLLWPRLTRAEWGPSTVQPPSPPPATSSSRLSQAGGADSDSECRAEPLRPGGEVTRHPAGWLARLSCHSAFLPPRSSAPPCLVERARMNFTIAIQEESAV